MSLQLHDYFEQKISEKLQSNAVLVGDIMKDDLRQGRYKDIQKRTRTLADELQQKMENLKQMDRMKTDFVANVSHELTTPLTSIRGYIETLQDKAINDKDKARKFISIIKEHADRLENIINDLLSLSELELSRDCIEKTDCDLESLIDEVALGFGHALAEKNQILNVNPQGSHI